MTRNTEVRRNSRPDGPKLFSSSEEKAEVEARNGLIQFDKVLDLTEKAISEKNFHLRPSTIIDLQRLAIQNIYSCAGTYRQQTITIQKSTHVPPPFAEITRLVEEMCDYVNDNWKSKNAVHLAAYVMWRSNWIHPFLGGNGRTARAVSYLVMTVRAGFVLRGVETVADQIVENRQPYYDALDAADAAWKNQQVDVSKMEALLERLLAKQLVTAHDAATCEENAAICPKNSQQKLDTGKINRPNSTAKLSNRATSGKQLAVWIGSIAIIVAAIIGAYVASQPPKCTPNETKECKLQCEEDSFASQTCQSDGKWNPCECLPPPQAGNQ